uniref:B30.2/SPRY domain-containing protein n=1 Tax=Myripristis murdjan TaxID=586833 RepID=A0A668AJI7_9TELE
CKLSQCNGVFCLGRHLELLNSHDASLAIAISNLCLYCVLFCPSDSCQVKLDPNTANRHLKLSEDNREATQMRKKQPYRRHPERFERYQQVLCGTGLTGRCYWEVERRVDSADSWLGGNDKSWSLVCFGEGYFAYHNKRGTDLRVRPPSDSGKVAVYLDWPAGSLSFYWVFSETLIHLHTFTCTFTEPVYPAFALESGFDGAGFLGGMKIVAKLANGGYCSSVSLCEMEEEEQPLVWRIITHLLK